MDVFPPDLPGPVAGPQPEAVVQGRDLRVRGSQVEEDVALGALAQLGGGQVEPGLDGGPPVPAVRPLGVGQGAEALAPGVQLLQVAGEALREPTLEGLLPVVVAGLDGARRLGVAGFVQLELDFERLQQVDDQGALVRWALVHDEDLGKAAERVDLGTLLG